jgi:hypothetical protein
MNRATTAITRTIAHDMGIFKLKELADQHNYFRLIGYGLDFGIQEY